MRFAKAAALGLGYPARHEPAQLMRFAIKDLTPEDLVGIAAYVASRVPVQGKSVLASTD